MQTRWQVGEVFERLHGDWTFVRQVPGQARMTGHATVRPDGRDAARYHETAEVMLPGGGILTGRQSYIYRRAPQGDGLQILFAETAQVFETLAFTESVASALQATAQHICKADSYTSHYEFGPGETWSSEHAVLGPRKSYSVTTVYCRSAETSI